MEIKFIFIILCVSYVKIDKQKRNFFKFYTLLNSSNVKPMG